MTRMFKSLSVAALPCVASLACMLPLAIHAQVEGPGPVSVIVRAESKNGEASLSPTDLKLQFNGAVVPLDSLRPLLGAGSNNRVAVALLIDDSLRGNFGNQLQDIETFVQATISPQVAIGIGYMQNGGAVFPAGFSTEAEQEIKAIRMPMSVGNITASPYFCLQDLLKKWPRHQGEAHVVIMITNGIDAYNGSVNPANQDSPYVKQAITDAQREGVPVYSIYYGRREVNSNLGSFSGQSYLSEVAEGTGGDSFNGGSINPVSLSPYFKQFQNALHESYMLTFQTGNTKMQRLKVTSNTKGVKLFVQEQAGVAGAK